MRKKEKDENKTLLLLFSLVLLKLDKPNYSRDLKIIDFLMTRLIRFFSRWTKLWGATEQNQVLCLCKNKHKCAEKLCYHTGWSPLLYEPRCEKTGLRGFRPGPTQTRLCSYRRWLEAWNFVFRKRRDCTIRVTQTKALISFGVTAKLICVLVFA